MIYRAYYPNQGSREAFNPAIIEKSNMMLCFATIALVKNSSIDNHSVVNEINVLAVTVLELF